MSLAVTKRKKSILILAWLAPLIAIAISVGMMYEKYTKNGQEITITFKNIDGFDIRQSHIQLNGLQIGDITSLKIDPTNIDTFIVQAKIYKSYSYLIKEGSVFYKVSPKITLKELSAVGNILKGNYIELIPATKNLHKLKILPPKFSFIGHDTKPKEKGVLFELTSQSGDFDITSAILYKGVQIGEIIEKEIDNLDIVYKVLVYEKYRYLLSSQTKFYKMNPLEIKASLENIAINIPSLQNLLSSAIGFITPSLDTHIASVYTLYESKNMIEHTNNSKTPYRFTFLANDISDTDFIYYKGVIVGKIDAIHITNTKNKVTAHLKEEYKYLINNSTVFYKQNAIKSQISREGIKIEVADIKELVLGGVTFTTPEKSQKLTKKEFEFYEDIDKLYVEGKFNFTLTVKDNYNLTKLSKLYYKNREVAYVKDISLQDDIVITLEAPKKYKYLFGKNSKMYLKGATLSLEKIENISSAFLGDNLYLLADKNNGFKSDYTLDAINPSDIHYKKGVRVKLHAKESKNIAIDSPIYYKGFEIGIIYDADLTPDGETIIFDLFIEEKYQNILKEQSRFYKVTTIDIDAGLFGAKIKMGSAKAMLKGGIHFINTPTNPDEKNRVLTPAKNGMVFELLEKKE